MEKSSRIEELDIAKGIGIVLVVIGHLCPVDGSAPVFLEVVQSFLYQFHVPLFFFVSGLFFKENDSWSLFIKKQFYRLYVPYIVANLLFLLADIVIRLSAGVCIIPIDELKHAAKVLMLLAVTPMGGATWFLKSLLVCSTAFKLLFPLWERSRGVAMGMCCLCSAIGLYAPASFSLSATLVALLFYSTGFLFKNRVRFFSAVPKVYSILLLVILTPILFATAIINKVDVASALYSCMPMFFPVAFGGIIAVLTLASLIKGTFSGYCFSLMGKNSMCILIGHFASFKMVIVASIIVAGLPISVLASHPCYNCSGVWWLLYLIVGVGIPLLITHYFSFGLMENN